MSDLRTPERLRFHYEVEKKLASRLKNSTASERQNLYQSVYEELFNTVDDHPQLVRKKRTAQRTAQVANDAQFVSSFLTPDEVYLEIGAGDCALTRLVSAKCKEAHAVDVSPRVVEGDELPSNVYFHLTDGQTLPLGPGIVDLTFSNQLIEHLHPDDFLSHLTMVRNVLSSHGKYVISTPHPYCGPHDISMYFDPVATGLHLKEYRRAELAECILSRGYRRVSFVARIRQLRVEIPVGAMILLEAGLGLLPLLVRRKVAKLPIVRNVLDSYVFAYA